ncbi:hypothetical protein PIGHUM_01911 [Pigmentiphaga humi]|uniref:Uncharacterized protein n=1 Tax=Pigmentiphaga humi TaxID=2478468 RepID=A0A3P4B2S1_9BURK|nr:hypothetical protein PIGHUM_01911 [Pigmentiphaga humi]
MAVQLHSVPPDPPVSDPPPVGDPPRQPVGDPPVPPAQQPDPIDPDLPHKPPPPSEE